LGWKPQRRQILVVYILSVTGPTMLIAVTMAATGYRDIAPEVPTINAVCFDEILLES